MLADTQTGTHTDGTNFITSTAEAEVNETVLQKRVVVFCSGVHSPYQGFGNSSPVSFNKPLKS